MKIRIHKIVRGVGRAFLLLLLVGMLLLFMMKTSPDQASLSLTLVPLVLVWGIVFVASTHLEYVFRKVRYSYIATLSAVSATVCTLLLMFSALGSVGLFDVVLLISLAVLGVFYFRRSWPK